MGDDTEFRYALYTEKFFYVCRQRFRFAIEALFLFYVNSVNHRLFLLQRLHRVCADILSHIRVFEFYLFRKRVRTCNRFL